MRMYIRYSGPGGDYLAYRCSYASSNYGETGCQEVRAAALEAEVERLVMEALAPDRIALAVAALDEFEKEKAALTKQWQLRLERARYETERAGRQYSAVEPENRLVACSLEGQWEEKLRGLEALEREYQQWQGEKEQQVTPEDQEALLALGADLQKLWRAPTSTFADRKHIVRLSSPMSSWISIGSAAW